MIYDQQTRAAHTLHMLETKVKQLKEHFIQLILAKKPWTTREEIERVFKSNTDMEVSSVLKQMHQK